MSKRTNRRKLRKQIARQTHEKWQERRVMKNALEFASRVGEKPDGLDPIRHDLTLQ